MITYIYIIFLECNKITSYLVYTTTSTDIARRVLTELERESGESSAGRETVLTAVAVAEERLEYLRGIKICE